MWICIAHHREHASNALLLPVRRRWSPSKTSPWPDISKHGHGHGLVHRVVCLFTPPAFAGYSLLCLPAERWLRLSRPAVDAWFCAEVVYPSYHPGTNRAGVEKLRWSRPMPMIDTTCSPPCTFKIRSTFICRDPMTLTFDGRTLLTTHVFWRRSRTEGHTGINNWTYFQHLKW